MSGLPCSFDFVRFILIILSKHSLFNFFYYYHYYQKKNFFFSWTDHSSTSYVCPVSAWSRKLYKLDRQKSKTVYCTWNSGKSIFGRKKYQWHQQRHEEATYCTDTLWNGNQECCKVKIELASSYNIMLCTPFEYTTWWWHASVNTIMKKKKKNSILILLLKNPTTELFPVTSKLRRSRYTGAVPPTLALIPQLLLANI